MEDKILYDDKFIENNRFIIDDVKIDKPSETLKIKDINGNCYTLTFEVIYLLIKGEI
jgi:hypothetical protein